MSTDQNRNVLPIKNRIAGLEEILMTSRDRDLLNKQFRWLTSKPQNNGVLILAIVGVFFAGIALGGSLSAHENKPVPVSPKASAVGVLLIR